MSKVNYGFDLKFNFRRARHKVFQYGDLFISRGTLRVIGHVVQIGQWEPQIRGMQIRKVDPTVEIKEPWGSFHCQWATHFKLVLLKINWKNLLRKGCQNDPDSWDSY